MDPVNKRNTACFMAGTDLASSTCIFKSTRRVFFCTGHETGTIPLIQYNTIQRNATQRPFISRYYNKH